MKKYIPNFITFLNLASGSVALFMVLNEFYTWALILILAAAVFDFFDGFTARILNAGSEVGKQLDSLADLVSFGLVPAAMIFMIMKISILPNPADEFSNLGILHKGMLVSVVIVPLFSALRLARFNVQKETNDFIGLPTPAFAIFWTGIYFDIYVNNSVFGQSINSWFFWGLMLMMSLFMLVPLPMLSLKFKDFSLGSNFSRYLLILLSIIILIFIGIPGLTLVILAYILPNKKWY